MKYNLLFCGRSLLLVPLQLNSVQYEVGSGGHNELCSSQKRGLCQEGVIPFDDFSVFISIVLCLL